ncbi:amidohydrolase [Bartonella sp. DGB1]|uniref:amidohydrolase family protein n=1 Tax=Bartonella sp. DGB1 TaxID=3239807 RepID=UPI003526AC86
MIIDSHQHFWLLKRNDYKWLTPDMKVLYRDFLPGDLQPHLEKNNIFGTILVQAAATEAETDYILSLANNDKNILGVVGWVDFDKDNIYTRLDQLATNVKFVGIRPMLQDIEQTDWILKEDYQNILSYLVKKNLTFDALIFPKHLEIIDKLADNHPNLKIIVNHLAKPNIDDKNEFECWKNKLQKLAHHKNVHCKFSGLLTQSEKLLTLEELQPYVTIIIEAFGSDRILWGSDWPVLTLKSTYDIWCKMSKQLLSGYSDAEITQIMGTNAIKFYNLKNI